ncbi:unnamed protein product [Lactuca saligna]|uniref:Uncharacterized protein n=1 Tax=Lactuca saligna TaxID=75948 RepID=A0AA35ZWQ1_LACSI|nr:unnamed protein product [Lactuca saligna]
MYYLEIENERVDKRINKLEDDLEKLKRGVLNVSEAASCHGKLVGKPVKKHATPVKKDETPVKKERGDMEEGNGIEKKNKKKEKQNVTLQRSWTREQMKKRIKIEKSSIL